MISKQFPIWLNRLENEISHHNKRHRSYCFIFPIVPRSHVSRSTVWFSIFHLSWPTPYSAFKCIIFDLHQPIFPPNHIVKFVFTEGLKMMSFPKTPAYYISTTSSKLWYGGKYPRLKADESSGWHRSYMVSMTLFLFKTVHLTVATQWFRNNFQFG